MKRSAANISKDEEENDDVAEDGVAKEQEDKRRKLSATLNQQYAEGSSGSVSDRDNPLYAWLRGSKEDIAKHVGRFVSLPTLPCSFPKQFDSTVASYYFLSAQRASMLHQIISDFESTVISDQKGLALYGPHGVGKSSFTYLVAAFAWVNRYPLIFIVCVTVLLAMNINNLQLRPNAQVGQTRSKQAATI